MLEQSEGKNQTSKILYIPGANLGRQPEFDGRAKVGPTWQPEIG